MDFNSEVGNRIRNARTLKGLSLKELGEAVNLSEGTIQRYETGQIKGVDVNLLKKIAKAIDCSEAYLMGWEDKPEDTNHYYTNPESREIAQQVFENRDLRMLFDAAKDVSPEDIQIAVDMLKRFKK